MLQLQNGGYLLSHSHLNKISLSIFSQQDRKSIIMLDRANNLNILKIELSKKTNNRWQEEYFLYWDKLPILVDFCKKERKRQKYLNMILPEFYVEIGDDNGN